MVIGSDSRPTVGYVISHYPFISHTFIQREVLGLRDAGFVIETISIVETGDDQIMSPTDRAESDRTLNVRPVNLRKVLTHLVKPAMRNLGAVLALVRLAGSGWWGDPKPLLWRLFYVAESVMLWSLANERDIEHLHAHHANSASNMAWLASEFGRRVGSGPREWSFTMHGSSEFVDIERIDLGKKAEAARGVACISDYTRSQLMMVAPPQSWAQFEVVHCGVDIDVYSPPTDPPDTDVFSVLFVGRLGSEKGLPVLVDAVAELQRRLSPRPVELLVVGDGELRHELEAQVSRHDLDATFFGSIGQHEILPLYHRANVFCLASFREGIPVVLMEAMACEIPCVAPRITALPELIEEGNTGLLFTAGRSDHCADALEQVATDPDLARTMGKAGREKVGADFTTAGTVSGMVDFFDRILDRPGDGTR